MSVQRAGVHHRSPRRDQRALLEFVDAGGYRDPQWWRPDDWTWLQREAITHPLFWERHGDRWYWRAMFELVPLPPAWPVYVSQAEASAFARWRGARPADPKLSFSGRRTDPRPARRAYPWGDSQPDGHARCI